MDETYLTINDEFPSVQTHLSILQSIIQRMSSDSSSCKSWCITLVSAILVIVADKGKPDYAWIALLPTIVFAYIDAYYLALEKGFIETYNEFVCKLHNNNLQQNDLYAVKPKGKMLLHQIAAFKSPAIWGFYAPLLALIYITKTIAIG